jgi:hypothetical protein
MKTRTRNRRTGYIVDVLPSKSAGFYAIAKDADGTPYFCYGKSFMGYPMVPKIGHSIEFTPLPPAGSGPLQRATEIQIKRSTRGGAITIGHDNGITRLILRAAGHERVLGELQL